MRVGTQTLAVELSFDPSSEERLTATWARLSREYVRCDSSELGVRPHLSLAVFHRRRPSDLGKLISNLAAGLRPFRLQFGQIGAFRKAEGVVFIEPEASPELLAAHRILMADLAEEEALVHPLYRKDAWVPHCTLATGVPMEEIERIIDVCRSTDPLGPVTVCRVAMVQYRPPIELCAFEMKSDPSTAGPR